MDDTLHRRQADPCAFELFRAVEPLERAEQLLGVGHVEARAVVPYEVGGRAVLLGNAELDPGGAALSGELPGVAEQVFEHDAQERGVSTHPNSTARRGSRCRSSATTLCATAERSSGALRSSARLTRARCSRSSMRCAIRCVAARTRRKWLRPSSSSRAV